MTLVLMNELLRVLYFLLDLNFIDFLHQPVGFGESDNNFLVMQNIFKS